MLKTVQKALLLCLSVTITLTLVAQRGQVHRSEYDDGDGGDSSLLGYIIILAVIFGIPYLIAKYFKGKDEKKKNG